MPSTFILVHGAWSGRYAWAVVQPLLKQAGHRVVAFDLPAHGDDVTPAAGLTLSSYVQATIRRIEAEAGPVVLVGHSLAGMIISQVAELISHRISRLVYLCAYLPADGQSAFDFRDADSLLPPNLVVAPDQQTATIQPAAIVPIFAADCPLAVQELVVARHRPEPLAPFQQRVMLTAANFGQVPKFYVETQHDVGISTRLQRQMLLANGSVADVVALDCGHSPFFAQPEALVSVLTGL
ncbi:alpha/beta fold hydrolase [Hymenobacter cellulosivorans]|uniref:Alpha/beta fold hydrolase n=1 Tax=Hymenobacter cellulosivorans TaxID=2932249 RepID=A0ABY4F898_9BACT|nr:alpha/beta fold hydrolase [Hymenobacter cellulosivorans]UOQ52247.1 alpha/beta fold hydrolase [Hymenobacter cellulosivorans]